MRRPVLLLALPALAGALLVPPAGAAPGDTVSVAFGTPAPGAAVDLTSTGTAAVVATVVSANGGRAVDGAAATGPTGALSLPAYTNGKPTAPRAVVAVTNAGQTDALAPGSASFAYGADVWLNPVNRGTSTDNGNNVVQRGLAGSGAQYKLQLDSTTADCRVEGAAGTLTASVAAPTAAWYRLTCTVTAGTAGPTADTVTVSAAPIAADGTVGAAATTSVTGPVGSLAYAGTVPLSIGGKLTPTGALAASGDQFNGRLDNVWLRIG